MTDPGLSTAAIIFLFVLFATVFAFFLILLGRVINPTRPNPVKAMPYESGMDPIHGARRRFDVRFHLVAIAFLIFDVELLFLYPWAVLLGENRSAAQGVQAVAESEALTALPEADDAASAAPAGEWTGNRFSLAGGAPTGLAGVGVPPLAFEAGVVFAVLLVLGYVYDWRKGVFRWR